MNEAQIGFRVLLALLTLLLGYYLATRREDF